MWQEIIVGIAIASAAIYTLRRYLPRKASGKVGSCGSCSGCSTGCGSVDSPKAIHLVHRRDTTTNDVR
jgi:hypothetical protein